MIILVPLRKLLTSLSENIKSLTIHIKHLKTLSQTLNYLKCIKKKKLFSSSQLLTVKNVYTFICKERKQWWVKIMKMTISTENFTG